MDYHCTAYQKQKTLVEMDLAYANFSAAAKLVIFESILYHNKRRASDDEEEYVLRELQLSQDGAVVTR